MNYNKFPCDECPFRINSLNGWLGGFTPSETQRIALSESDFQCHKTRETGKERSCAGRFLFAANCFKQFRVKEMNEIMNRLIEKNPLHKKQILDFTNFNKHHSNSNQ
jgi:Family of unknown function (DUF6283)